jgi:diaminopropionate ammonia-lyase
MPEPSVSDIRAFHQTWPQYRPTPLIPLPDLAGQLRVGSILVKDEAARMGLGSFKVLGSSWAIHQRTKRLLRSHDPDPWPLGAMRDVLGMHGSPGLCSASDGNHGHALAVLAARLGLACSIYLPAGADLRRIAQIEG